MSACIIHTYILTSVDPGGDVGRLPLTLPDATSLQQHQPTLRHFQQHQPAILGGERAVWNVFDEFQMWLMTEDVQVIIISASTC